MLRKIKNIVIGFFCFSFISVIWLSAPMNFEDGGANMNKFLAFGLWILSVFLIVKGKAIVATVGSIAIFFAIVIPNGGVKFNNANWDGLVEIVVGFIGILAVGKIFINMLDSHEKTYEEIGERKEDARKKGLACCPYCGSTSIQYYPLGVPYKDYDCIRDVEVVRHYSSHYHCNNCDKSWG